MNNGGTTSMPSFVNRNQKIVIDLIPNVGLKDITFGMCRNDVRKIMNEKFGEVHFVLRSEETDCSNICNSSRN